jgi:hypothetical protein
MKKISPKAQRLGKLPGFEQDLSQLPREHRLRIWLSEHGLGLIDLCGLLGRDGVPCHKSYPGKVLISCVDRLPDHQRQSLIDFGIPEDLLPERIEIRHHARPVREKRPNPLAL